MKLKLVLILCCVGNLSANSLLSQQSAFSVAFENKTLVSVFEELKVKTGYSFTYNKGTVNENERVTVEMKDATLEEILTKVLTERGYKYEVADKVIFVSAAKNRVLQQPANVTVTGTARNVAGQPVAGVSVYLKGDPRRGTSTDANGKFLIAVPQQKEIILVFSFLGMHTKEVDCSTRHVVDVVMEESSIMSEEVVVTGYQTIDKSKMAGSYSTITKEDLLNLGTQTLEQLLQGKLAGVVVQNQDGLVGTRQKTRVRGTSTLLGNQEPVWVVDGIIQEDPLPFKASEFNNYGTDASNSELMRNFVGNAISWLNPIDIEDITVLKDASATAIYGVKAANGVIVITTKKGSKDGRVYINYAGNASVSSKVTYDKMNLMNSQERIDVSREIYNEGLLVGSDLQPVGYQAVLKEYLDGKISADLFNEQIKRLETVNTDWFDLLFRNAVSHNHSVGVSGGNEKTQYSASVGANFTNGTSKGNKSDKYTGKISLTSVFWDRLTIDVSLAASIANTDSYTSQVSPYSYASKTSRVIAAFDDDGKYFFYPHQANGYRYNVLNELDLSGATNMQNYTNLKLGLRYRIFDDLFFRTNFGLNYASSVSESWADERTNYITDMRGYEFGEYMPTDKLYKQSVLPHGGELNMEENRNTNYMLTNTLDYTRRFGTHHYVSVSLIQEMRSNMYRGFSETTYGYLPGRGKKVTLPPAMIETGGTQMIANRLYAYNFIKYNVVDRTANYLSFAGAATYMYDNRYVLNASIRSDATNRFGQDKSARYQPVWSIGLRWNAVNEPWMQDQDLISALSLRFSYGFQGNVAENIGPDLITVIPTDYGGLDPTTGEYVLKVKYPPAPGLKWEKSKSLNYGLDFGFFNNKITGVFEYYHKKGTDIITSHNVAYENGVTSMPMNSGEMLNYGWEVSLSFVPVRTRDFIWNLSVNTSKNYNKVQTRLEANDYWYKAVSGTLDQYGYPVTSFWAFRFTELDPDTGMPVFDLTGEDTAEAKLNAVKYMKYMGKLDPDLSAGLTTSFQYKNIRVSSSFTLQVGGKKFLSNLYSSDITNLSGLNEYQNLPKDLVDRWRKPGDELNTNIPVLPQRNNVSRDVAGRTLTWMQMYNYSDIRVVNASFLRCQNINISYSMPEKLIRNWAGGMSLSFTMSNPFIIASKDYKGKDPEVASGRQPITRTYNFGLSVNFK